MWFYLHSFFKNLLLPSTPFNNLIEYEDYDLKEALSTIIPDPVPTTGLVSSSTHLPRQEDEQTFLSLHLFKLYRRHSIIPLQFLTQTSTAIQNCTFEHPIWSKQKWNKIWKSKPFVLNPITVPVPTIETTFHGTLLHIHLTTEHLTSSTPLEWASMEIPAPTMILFTLRSFSLFPYISRTFKHEPTHPYNSHPT